MNDDIQRHPTVITVCSNHPRLEGVPDWHQNHLKWRSTCTLALMRHDTWFRAYQFLVFLGAECNAIFLHHLLAWCSSNVSHMEIFLVVYMTIQIVIHVEAIAFPGNFNHTEHLACHLHININKIMSTKNKN